jgi:hypothetical protein
MLRKFRPPVHHATVVAYMALFVALGGGALAATSFVGSDGNVRGCVGKKRALTVLKAGHKCKKGQSHIEWSQKGPKGDAGVGERGLKGDTGPGAAFKTASVADVLTLQGDGDFFISAGPNVTVTVPASGLIEVWAEAELRKVSGSTAYPPMVGLREDGVDSFPLPPCQFDIKGILTIPEVATSPFTRVFTGGPECGRTVNPTSLIFRTSPGTHTYSMVYVNRGTSVVEYRNRFLAVAPRP